MTISGVRGARLPDEFFKVLRAKGQKPGANGRGRTDDLRFTKPLLYH